MEEKKEEVKITFAVKLQVKEQDIIDWIVTALEGGSNYWYMLNISNKDLKKHFHPDQRDTLAFSEMFAKCVLNKSMSFEIFDYESEEDKLGDFNNDAIKQAISLLCEHHPMTWGSLMNGDYDDGDADVFFQLAVMGDITFG